MYVTKSGLILTDEVQEVIMKIIKEQSEEDE